MKAIEHTPDALVALEDHKVFEWVKTGYWSMADFKIWSLKVRGAEYSDGFEAGKSQGE